MPIQNLLARAEDAKKSVWQRAGAKFAAIKQAVANE